MNLKFFSLHILLNFFPCFYSFLLLISLSFLSSQPHTRLHGHCIQFFIIKNHDAVTFLLLTLDALNEEAKRSEKKRAVKSSHSSFFTMFLLLLNLMDFLHFYFLSLFCKRENCESSYCVFKLKARWFSHLHCLELIALPTHRWCHRNNSQHTHKNSTANYSSTKFSLRCRECENFQLTLLDYSSPSSSSSETQNFPNSSRSHLSPAANQRPPQLCDRSESSANEQQTKLCLFLSAGGRNGD